MSQPPNDTPPPQPEQPQPEPPAYGAPQPPYGAPQPPYPGQPYPGQPYPGQQYPMRYQPPMSPAEERTWGMLAHLSPFAGSVVGLPVLGPLVVYLIYKDRSPFVRRHSAAALNFQIMLLIVSIAGVVVGFALTIMTAGLGLIILIPLAVVIWIGAIVLQIMGAVAANRGQEFRYPLTPDMVT